MARIEYFLTDTWTQISTGANPIETVVKGRGNGRLLFNDTDSDTNSRPYPGLLYEEETFIAEPVWVRVTPGDLLVGNWVLLVIDR